MELPVFALEKDSFTKAYKKDYEAISMWLNEYKGKQTTFRSYQKEAERFLLWCLLNAKKNLCAINRQDFEQYFNFLLNPSPKQFWCAPKGSKKRRRGEKGWRPFVGPLSISARNNAVSILNSMMCYLVDARYLEMNPLMLMRKKQKTNLAESKIRLEERILQPEEWEAIQRTLINLPETPKKVLDEKARLVFLVKILFYLGLRISELEKHKWNAFRFTNGNWWFYVVGKGDKLSKIPVNSNLLSAVKQFRCHLKLSELPQSSDDKPIIPSWSSPNALGSRQMHQLLKSLGEKASKEFEESSVSAVKLKSFSAHWLRHLSASMQDRAGVSFKHIRENLRHSHDEITRRYVHAFDEERHLDMQKLSMAVLEEN